MKKARDMKNGTEDAYPVHLDRRSFFMAALTGSALAVAPLAGAEAQHDRDWSGQIPSHYPDADIVVLDKNFSKYKVNNAAIERLYTGLRWAEGPAWSGSGQYLVFSDIPNNRQLRWLEEDGHVSIFRSPSGYSNGNTFDWEGRQLSCEHLNRRVVRYEHDGEVTVLANKWQGKPFNAPNDIVVHPDAESGFPTQATEFFQTTKVPWLPWSSRRPYTGSTARREESKW
jgi:gluconolactonase